MKSHRNIPALIRWSAVLATGGVLILTAAVGFLAIALWRHSLIGGQGATNTFVPPSLIACFIVASIIVTVASAFAWHIANHQSVLLVKRRSIVAIVCTAIAWLIVGVAVLFLSHG